MDLTTRASTLVPAPRLSRVLVVAAVVLGLLAATLLIVGSRRPVPPPFGPARNGAIVYSDGGDLFLAEPGAEPRTIVGGPTVDVGATYSHDGTRIAFLRAATDRGLDYLVMNADGTDLRTLTKEPLDDPDNWDWSPDGRQLVVMHTIDGRHVLSLLATDGGGSIRRLETGDLDATNPAWRPPDGDEIVFRGTTNLGRSAALYAIRADGTGLHPLTPVAGEGAYAEARLSADGNSVAFVVFGEADASPDGTGGHVHVLDLKTGTERPIAVDPTAANDVGPVFSPDDRQVAFRRYGENVPMRLMLAPVDGSGPARQVGPSQAADGDYIVDFSPDGTELFVAIRGAGLWQLIDVADGSVASGVAFDDWAHWQRVAAVD